MHRFHGLARQLPEGGGHWRQRATRGTLALLLLAGWTLATAHAANATGEQVPARAFQWGAFLAPFHAVVLHFPIGFFTVAVILEIHRLRRPDESLKTVTRMVLWLSLVAGMVAAAFGILRARGGGYDHQVLALHRWTGLSIPLLTLATLGLQRRAYRPGASRGILAGYHLMLLVTLAQLVVAGHFGGNLTHGSGYLTENAPRFVQDLLESAPANGAARSASPAAGDPAQRARPAEIDELFTSKCLSCHGPGKQKGGYRVDRARQPGASGQPPIVAGDPFASHLVRLILLPPGHDDIMPPAGKTPLTAEEILMVIRWIQAGAPD